jgi:hypothetical protein
MAEYGDLYCALQREVGPIKVTGIPAVAGLLDRVFHPRPWSMFAAGLVTIGP